MVKSFFEKLNLEKLQTAYQFCVEYWDVNSNLLNENEVLISFGKELQLVFFCDEHEELSAKIINKHSAVFDNSLTEDLETKMNQLLRSKLTRPNISSRVESVFQLLKNTLKNEPTESSCVSSNKNNANQSPSTSKALFHSHESKCGLKITKKPPMKTSLDVINRIKWDKSLDSSKFTVAYEDRFAGIVEKAFGEFDWDSDLASVGPEVLAIPQHRIQYFKYGNRVVWKKENRLDDFFGSTGGGKNILDVIKEEEQIPDLVEADSTETPINQNTMCVTKPESNLPTLTEAQPQEKTTISSPSAKSKKRSIPNFFIGVRVNRADVSENASKYLKKLENAFRYHEEREEFLQATVSPTKLHVTLCVCSLDNETEIEKVKQVLEKMYITQKKLELSVCGVGQFDNAVVFAKVNSKALCDIEKRLVSALQDENINLSANYPDYIPHMTLVKIPWAKKYLFSRIAQFVQGKRFRNWNFGTPYYPIKVKDLLLCKIRTTDKETGFYETVLSCPIKYHEQASSQISTQPCISREGPVTSQADSECNGKDSDMDQESGENLMAELPGYDDPEEMDVSTTLAPFQPYQQSVANYFIGIHINREDVTSSASKFVFQLENAYKRDDEREEFAQAIVPPWKRHISLCQCTLRSEEEIERVKEVLHNMSMSRRRLELKLHGVGKYKNEVVYAKVNNSRSFDDLRKRLVFALKKENIDLSANPHYGSHMELVRFPCAKQHLFSSIADTIKKKYQNWKFGRQRDPIVVQELLLCKIDSTDENTRFYETLVAFPLQGQEHESFHQNHDRRRDRFKRKAEDWGCLDERRPPKHRHSNDVFISKTLTAVLRHNKFGFKVDSEGYLELTSLLRHQRFHGVTVADLHRIVETNDKQRFTIHVDETGVQRIKANQGHSVEVENLSLTEITNPEEYPAVVHGTFWGAWASIQHEGLHRKSRIHIHMTTAEPSHANHVISGMRKSCNIFIYIDIKAAMRDGIKFFLSSNGVILSSGDENGYLRPKYFRNVVGISNGKRSCLLDKSETSSLLNNEDTTSVKEEVQEVVEDMLKLCLQSNEEESGTSTVPFEMPLLSDSKNDL